jgi:hypothetical protein
MPLAPPPSATASPQPVVLAAGTRLWRVHKRTRCGSEFKAVGSDPHFGGGRFDSTSADPYPYLYAASERQTALLETLVRGIPFNDRGGRLIRRAAIADFRISAFGLTQDLTMLSLLTTPDLAAACQDEWLVQAVPSDYPQTRRWAQWLRSQAPWAQGFVWPSRRDLGRQAFILFGDRSPSGVLCFEPGSSVVLDDAEGADWINTHLAPYRISVKPPSRRSVTPWAPVDGPVRQP